MESTEVQARIDAAVALSRKDNYYNQNSGFGGSRDPVNQASFVTPASLKRNEVEDLYAGAWIVRRAVDVLPEDATREWVDFKTDDKGTIEKVNQKAKDLGLRKHTFEAIRLARLYGGSILVIGAMDSQKVTEPLNEDSIKSIDYLFSIDRWQLHINKRYDDPEKPKFREPELYQINPQFGGETQHMIHESRVIRFDGAWLPVQKQKANQGWHDSVLTSMISDIKNFIMSNQVSGQLLQDFITKVLEMPNLSDLIENQEFNSIEARIQYALAAMSNVGLSLIQGGDNGEKFSKIQTPITGYKDLLESMNDMVCAAIGQPKVKLFGQQPGKLAGLDETIRIYNDEVSAYQETELREPIERAYSLITKSKDTLPAPPKAWTTEFNPLRKMTEMEKAEVQDKQSQSDERYLMNGVLFPEEVRDSRFTEDGFKTDTTLDEESRGEMKDIDEDDDLNKGE